MNYDFSIVIVFMILILGIPIALLLASCRKDEKEEKKEDSLRETDLSAWLKAEKAKPRFCLAVVTKLDADTLFSKSFEPRVSYGLMARYPFRYTSHLQARHVAERISQGSGYQHDGDTFYPHHQILRVTVTEVKS